jgi:hypothetical protein
MQAWSDYAAGMKSRHPVEKSATAFQNGGLDTQPAGPMSLHWENKRFMLRHGATFMAPYATKGVTIMVVSISLTRTLLTASC